MEAVLELQRTRYVVEHYAQLQGLRLVPLGACFLLSAAWRLGWLSWVPGTENDRGAQLWFLGMLGVAVAVSVPIKGWYRRHVGMAAVRPDRSGAATLTMAAAAVTGLASFPPTPWRVSLAGLLIATLLVTLGCAAGGLRRHYVFAGVAFLGLALAPALDVPPEARRMAFDTVVGLTLLAGGLGDHRLLGRLLRRAQGGPGGPDAGSA
jgi:hypothetical protein